MNKQNFKVDFMDISAVIPYEENPRQIGPDAVAKVAKSIKKYGFVSPIIVNDENDRVLQNCVWFLPNFRKISADSEVD